jgi:hypothetical protein
MGDIIMALPTAPFERLRRPGLYIKGSAESRRIPYQVSITKVGESTGLTGLWPLYINGMPESRRMPFQGSMVGSTLIGAPLTLGL